MNLIYVVSDPLENSRSVNKRVATAFLDALRTTTAELSIVEIDLNRDPPPYYGQELFRYVWEPVSNPGYQPSASERSAADYMLRLAEPLRNADVLLLAAPVWNYYLPAILKAWIDQVLSPGQMFELGPQGRVPLHQISALVSIVSAGGWMSEQGQGQSLVDLLQAPFRYAGIERCHSLLVEGQEPALYADHAQREADVIAAARSIASTIATEYRPGKVSSRSSS